MVRLGQGEGVVEVAIEQDGTEIFFARATIFVCTLLSALKMVE